MKYNTSLSISMLLSILETLRLYSDFKMSGTLWKCCGVIPIYVVWYRFLKVPPLHTLVFVQKIFCDLFLLGFFVLLFKREERWEGRPRGRYRCMVYKVSKYRTLLFTKWNWKNIINHQVLHSLPIARKELRMVSKLQNSHVLICLPIYAIFLNKTVTSSARTN